MYWPNCNPKCLFPHTFLLGIPEQFVATAFSFVVFEFIFLGLDGSHFCHFRCQLQFKIVDWNFWTDLRCWQFIYINYGRLIVNIRLVFNVAIGINMRYIFQISILIKVINAQRQDSFYLYLLLSFRNLIEKLKHLMRALILRVRHT